jgi:hypothetical protein
MWVMWIYMSPLPRMDGSAPTKVIMKIVLSVVIFGGLFAQLYFLAHSVPSNLRRLYLMALLVVEGIPILLIICFRDYHNRNSSGANHGNRTADSEEKDNTILVISPVIGTQEMRTGLNADGTMRAVIGPVRTPHTYYFAILVIIVGVVSLLGFQFVLANSNHVRSANTFVGVIRIVQAMSVLAVAYILLIIVADKETLVLGPERLEIGHCLLNLPVSKKSFSNHEIENLRYEHWKNQSRNGSVERSGIRFEARSKAYSIGKCVSETQANELIERMRTVYAFPVAREISQ